MSLFHTHFLLPLAEPERHAGLARRLREIRRFERLPASAQRAEQQQRLRRILQHAYDTVPLQRKRFDEAGFDPSQARIDRPLPLPVLTRDDLRNAGEQLISNAFRKQDLHQAGSSGTTSTPIQFFRDGEALRNKTALNFQLNSWAGYNVGDSVMTLWGAHRDMALNPSWRWRLYEETLMRRIPAAAGFLSEEILERFRIRYEHGRPKVLYAYSTVLAAFVSYLKTKTVRHMPKVLIATAEFMSDANRKMIEDYFGLQLFIHYGSRDTGMISAECAAHGGVHFHPWGAYTEFEPMGETPDGQAHRVLVTDLLNYGQPLVRYDTGDCVILKDGPCSCGRWFPMADRILGRASDGILLAEGSMIPGVSIGNHMSQMGQFFRSVAKVQFVQKSYEHIHLRYTLNSDSGSAHKELQSICTGIDSMASRQFGWTLEEVSDIPRERSGKIRICISEIPVPGPDIN